MRFPLPALLLSFCLALTGCSTLFGPPPMPGDTEDVVIARAGRLTATYQDGTIKILEFANIPWGQYTFMARMGPDGKLIVFEQVLTVEKFGTIVIDKDTTQDVLHKVGQPTETTFFPLIQMNVWSYRYKESGIWNSMMHIYFDKSGVVRRMENGRDPLYDRDDRR